MAAGRRAWRGAVLAAALAVVVVGCGGTSATAPGATVGAPAQSAPPATAAASAATATASPATDPDGVTVVFDVGGGCYDTAEPVGCGPTAPVEITEPADRAVVAERAPQLAALPVDGSVGCGGEFVDGVSVRASVEVTTGDDVDVHVVCLSDAPADDDAVTVLWTLFETTR